MSEPYDYTNAKHVWERAKKAVPNQGLTWLAVVAAKQHRYGIEYIEQAPVLVIGAVFGTKTKDLTDAEKIYVGNRFRRIKGMKLRAALAEFHIPYPLRKLRSTAVAPRFSRVIWELRSVPPSSLSQAIPGKVNHQRSWLGALSAARKRSDLRGRALPDGALEWLAMRLGGETPKQYKPRDLERYAADIADMLIEGRFNPAWTFDEAITAHGRWVAEMAKRDTFGTFAKKYGVDLEHEVDYSPQHNEPVSIDGFDIVPLRSGAALIEEGTTMRHCVPSYMRDILSGGSCIYSIQKNGRRVATLELTSGYGPVSIKQLKGPCNSAVATGVLGAATSFSLSIPKRQSAMETIKGMFGLGAKI